MREGFARRSCMIKRTHASFEFAIEFEDALLDRELQLHACFVSI
jgi:hypothetical protein